jgi:hypothetical protein
MKSVLCVYSTNSSQEIDFVLTASTAQDCLQQDSFGYDPSIEVFVLPSVCADSDPDTFQCLSLNNAGEPDMTLLIDYLLLISLVFAALLGMGHGMKR